MSDFQNLINSQIKSGIIPTVVDVFGNPINSSSVNSAVKDSNAATSERLYIVEPRSAQGLYNHNSLTDRGPTASIKLISTGNLLGGLSSDTRRFLGDVNYADYNALFAKVNTSSVYDRFILTACDVTYSEKTQIMTTFGDNEVVYYFGKNPVIMNLQGILIDSLTNDWFGSFVKIYQTFLRGTQLAKNFEMLELVLPNMKVTGSIISLSSHQDSARDTDIPFSMQFYAKEIKMLPQPILQSAASNSSATSIFFNPDRFSQGAGLPPQTTAITNNGFTEPTWLSNPGVISNITNTIYTGYAFFRNNIISPVVSVIASLTRIIQVISKDISSIVSSFTIPLNAILSDVMSISLQANAIAITIENTAADLEYLIGSTSMNLRSTLTSLKNTAGVICRLPEDVSSIFKRKYHRGRIGTGAAILHSGRNGTVSKSAILSSGSPYTAQNSFTISGN